MHNRLANVSRALRMYSLGSTELRPLLLFIFLNDVSSICIGESKRKLLADTVKQYSTINVDVSNCGDVQQSIDHLSSRAQSWQLCINISKC